MDNLELTLIILGMVAVTYPVRFFPLWLFNRIAIPRSFKIWLSFVPVSVFSALVTLSVYDPAQEFIFKSQLPILVGGLISVLTVVKTKSLGWGMGIGYGIFVLVQMSIL